MLAQDPSVETRLELNRPCFFDLTTRQSVPSDRHAKQESTTITRSYVLCSYRRPPHGKAARGRVLQDGKN